MKAALAHSERKNKEPLSGKNEPARMSSSNNSHWPITFKDTRPPLVRLNGGSQPSRPSAPPAITSSIRDVLRSPGEPLAESTRAFFESRLGDDLSHVRVHTNNAAAKSARSVGARAYTVGSDLVFAAGQYAPATNAGRRLLAHELSHTIQQQAGTQRSVGAELRFSQPTDTAEREADAAADAVAAGQSYSLTMSTPLTLARDLDDDRRASEVERTINDITSVLSMVNQIGAEVEFLFWVSNGAITLVNYRRTQSGGAPVRSFTSDVWDRFRADQHQMPTFIGTQTRYIRITYRRTSHRWEQRSFGTATLSGAPTRPPEGREMPAFRRGYSVDTFSRVTRISSDIVRQLNVPRRGMAEQVVTFELDDDRVGNWSPASYTATGERHAGGSVAPADPTFSADIGSLLLPMTSGLGPRTVRMVLRGMHSGGAANSTWHVAEAGVVRPATAVRDEADEIVREYRQVHEGIIRQWREQTREAGVMVASFALRELALMVIGGWVLRVFGLGIRAVAPTLYRFISSGTRVAAEYLETLIVRLLPYERAELQALLRKAEAEGIEALSVAERSRVNSIWARLEQLITARISDVEKGYLRTAMHGRYQAARATEVAAFEAAGRAYQIHHRLPLEYGHLFPGVDVNAGANLIGLDVTVHRGINAVWTRFRTVPVNRITQQEVTRVAQIVDRHFAQWYHQVPSTQGLGPAVEAATNTARAEVDALIRLLP